MVEVRCKTDSGRLLVDLEPFQGNLKRRSEEDIGRLAESIRSEGLLMPFAVWKDRNLLLDGHGRRLALLKLAESDADIRMQEFPVVYVEAETEEEARKALLQITSSYGKVSGLGVREFTRTIPEYHAPVLDKFVRKTPSRRKKGSVNKAGDRGEREIRILVRADKFDAVLKLFSQVDYIKVAGYGQ